MVTLSEFKDFAYSNMMEVERILHEVYSDLCSKFDNYTCFDGGAHKGHHTIRMLALPGCKRVIAVEADPSMAERLVEFIEREAPGDQRITIVQAALQRYPDVKSITWGSSSSHEGRSSIIAEGSEKATIWVDRDDMQYREATKVAATTIDRLVGEDVSKLPFIKLDLEGADLHALFGARDTLAKHRPVIAFENSVHAPKVHGFTLDEVIGYFYGLGYTPMSFVGEPLDRQNWFGFFEAWAAPNERADWLSEQLRSAVRRRGF